MKESIVESSLGLSREWDARKAGKEVAQTALEGLSSDPDFLLLFSTIHYEKHGGLQEFLNGVWDILPEKTPVIGGSVVGFMNNKGCFSMGGTGLAVSSPEIDVHIGIGNNTKRNPKKAAKQSYNMIKKQFDESVSPNKFLLNFVSGPEVMKTPGQGYKKVIESGFASKFVMQAFGFSQYVLQKGYGREDEIFDEMATLLPDCNMILGTSMDDYRALGNFQFYNDKVLTNSLINLGISTTLDIGVCTTHGMKKTDLEMDITKLSKNGHIIHKINGKPAVEELYNVLNWPPGFLNEKTMTNTILYYPISLQRHGREVPAVLTFILKNSIMTPCIVDKGKVSILTVSGRDLIASINDNLSAYSNFTPEFGILSTCMTILQTLGYKMNFIHNILSDFFKEKPFLMFFSAGEGTYSPDKGITYSNMSFNTALFGRRSNGGV
jgi:hypothetical protein